MSNQIIVPSLGESVTEATVAKWLKQVGEKVETDEPVVELETDKVNIEVPSPLSGTLSSIKVKEGDTVEVGSLLGLLEEGRANVTKKTADETIEQDEESDTPPPTVKKEEVVKEPASKSKKKAPNKKSALKLVDEHINGNTENTLVLETLAEEDVEKVKKEKYVPPRTKQNLSPAVRKIVEENKIDVSNFEGS